jgi:hypothetical protein
MRIELPSPTWADTQRAQDDAHTLTLPAQRLSLADSLMAEGEDGASLRVEIAACEPQQMTLTF